MSVAGAAIARDPSNRMVGALAALPVLVVLVAAWQYDLASNVHGAYRALVATVFMACAAACQAGCRCAAS